MHPEEFDEETTRRMIDQAHGNILDYARELNIGDHCYWYRMFDVYRQWMMLDEDEEEDDIQF